MIKRSIIILSILTVILCSCSYDLPCTSAEIQPSFIGFDSTEINSFILRRFEANDSFNVQIDSTKVSIFENNNVYAGDTTNVSIVYNGIMIGNDWQIYMPSLNRVVSISQITDIKKTEKVHFQLADKKAIGYCLSPIVSMVVNGVPYTYSDTETAFKLYITK